MCISGNINLPSIILAIMVYKYEARLLCTQGCNLVDHPYVQQVTVAGHGNESIPFVDKAQARKQAWDMARQADVIVCAMGENVWMISFILSAPQKYLYLSPSTKPQELKEIIFNMSFDFL